MTVETSYYTNQKKDRLFTMSLSLLIFVSIITAGLFGADWYVNKINTQITSDITALETSINALKKDKSIQVYDLMEANKGVLTSLKARSQVTSFIKHIKSVAYTYDMTLLGFDYANGIVTTKSLFSVSERGASYTKLVKFINDYRSKKENPMELLFVNSVTGQDQIEITSQFKVK